MGGNMAIRMTIDVCVFEDTRAETLMKRVIKAEGTATFGIGERLAREVMERIIAGDIEIDDIRDIEVHGA